MQLHRVDINGFKSLRAFRLQPSALNILVGPNGSGKTSIFSFFKFLRQCISQDIPPELLEGHTGQDFFDPILASNFTWGINILDNSNTITYAARLAGPLGHISLEQEEFNTTLYQSDGLIHSNTLFSSTPHELIIFKGPERLGGEQIEKKPNQSGLLLINSSRYGLVFKTKSYIKSWRILNAFDVINNNIRRAVVLEQDPILREDCSNLSSLLHYFMTEHPEVFNEIQFHLKQLVPGFSHLTVKARGGPGEVMAFWREQGVEQDLSLADLSDGILRLLCWMALFLHPKPPTLICIDEPDLGVHPRTLPLLAALIKKASVRTQIFVTTHNSYFLSQFDLENITVFRKENGATKAHKPKDSKVLVELLEEFGQGEIALMHQSEELEVL